MSERSSELLIGPCGPYSTSSSAHYAKIVQSSHYLVSSRVLFHQADWDQSAYEAIKMVHHYYHFDPSTTDLAGLFGFSILEVVGDDDRFETWEDSIEMTSTSDLGESGMHPLVSLILC
uniref:Uncharacterized protein n=1 Tax=Moniliophthora roreri TaxID=221103 RepID=A0A0W0G5P6_MONRR